MARTSGLASSITYPRGHTEWDDALQAFSNKMSAQDFFALIAKMPADFLYCDGLTTRRRIENIYGPLGAVAGSDLTWVGEPLDIPTSNPPGATFLFAVTSSNSNPSQAFSLLGYLETDGSLNVKVYGTTPASDFRLFKYAGFRAAFSGKKVRIIVSFTGGTTTAPVVWFDGVDASANFAATSGGTPPNWVDAALVSTYFLQGFDWQLGDFRPGRFINRKFAQADVDYFQINGRLCYADSFGGSMVNLLSASESAFSAGSTSWGSGNGGTATLNTGTQKLDVSGSGAGSGTRLSSSAARMGRWYKITGTLSSVTGSTVKIGTGTQGSSAFDYYVTGLGNGAFTAYVFTLRGTQLFVVLEGAGSFTLDDVTLVACGAFSDPVIQPILVLDDATLNGRAASMVGYVPVTAAKNWRVPAFVDMSGTGNKQLLSNSWFIDGSNQVIDTIESECTGTPTFSVGDGTTTTRFTASVAHSAGRLRETVSNNYPTAAGNTDVYANVTVVGTSAEKLVIRGHRT